MIGLASFPTRLGQAYLKTVSFLKYFLRFSPNFKSITCSLLKSLKFQKSPAEKHHR